MFRVFLPTSIRSGRVRRLTFAAAAVLLAAASAQAAPPTRFFDGAAREIISSLQAGNGWCVVTDRQKVALFPEAEPVDCVKFAVVVGSTQGKTSNDQQFVELQYSPETAWIAVEFGVPTASGPSLTAAKKANDAVVVLDQKFNELKDLLDQTSDPDVRALWEAAGGVLRVQRAALVDLIQKDVAAVGK